MTCVVIEMHRESREALPEASAIVVKARGTERRQKEMRREINAQQFSTDDQKLFQLFSHRIGPTQKPDWAEGTPRCSERPSHL